MMATTRMFLSLAVFDRNPGIWAMGSRTTKVTFSELQRCHVNAEAAGRLYLFLQKQSVYVYITYAARIATKVVMPCALLSVHRPPLSAGTGGTLRGQVLSAANI